MAYTTNPHIGKVRRDAVRLVKYRGWSMRKVARHIGAEASARFIGRAYANAPFCFKMIQTDHGSEFSAWFTHALWRMGMRHRHARVRQSNDNAYVERFNRTLQEECLDHALQTIKTFGVAFAEYLPYYNTKRLHMGLNYKTPLEVLRSS